MPIKSSWPTQRSGLRTSYSLGKDCFGPEMQAWILPMGKDWTKDSETSRAWIAWACGAQTRFQRFLDRPGILTRVTTTGLCYAVRILLGFDLGSGLGCCRVGGLHRMAGALMGGSRGGCIPVAGGAGEALWRVWKAGWVV